MGQFLPYVVETYTGPRRNTLGEFRRIAPARAAARLALHSPRVTFAVVKHDGRMVYAVDPDREWNDGEEVMPA
jgi:hypothetical protein